jgi:hypothetical protein
MGNQEWIIQTQLQHGVHKSQDENMGYTSHRTKTWVTQVTGRKQTKQTKTNTTQKTKEMINTDQTNINVRENRSSNQ